MGFFPTWDFDLVGFYPDTGMSILSQVLQDVPAKLLDGLVTGIFNGTVPPGDEGLNNIIETGIIMHPRPPGRHIGIDG